MEREVSLQSKPDRCTWRFSVCVSANLPGRIRVALLGEPNAIAWRLILGLLTLIRTARIASNDRRKRHGKMTLRSIEAQIVGKLVSLKYLEFPASQAAARCVRMSLKTGKVCIALNCDLSDHSFGSL